MHSCVKVVRECVERVLLNFCLAPILFQFEIKLFINKDRHKRTPITNYECLLKTSIYLP